MLLFSSIVFKHIIASFETVLKYIFDNVILGDSVKCFPWDIYVFYSLFHPVMKISLYDH